MAAEVAQIEQQEMPEDYLSIDGARLPLDASTGAVMPIPMAYLTASLNVRQQAVLWRWSDARQLIIGNRSVVFLNGEARGRYKLFAEKGHELGPYIRYECDAYRWVIANIHPESAKFLEIFARLQAGEMADVDFVGMGQYIANSDNVFIGVGAGIGKMSALADHLEEKYAEHHKTMENKEKRASAVLAAVRAHAALLGK